MNSKLTIFTLLLLLTSVNSAFSSNINGKTVAEEKVSAEVQKVAPPNWFHAGYLKRELAIFNSLEPNLQILVRGLLGTQVMQRKGGLKMLYPDDKRVYDLVISYLDVVGNERINNKVPLLGQNLLEYAIAKDNKPLIYELNERLADEKIKKHLTVEQLEKELATEAKSSLNSIPQL